MKKWNKQLNINQLDETLGGFAWAREVRLPSTGWIKTIRKALGMSSRTLGERLGLSQPRIAQLEKGEAEGTITLNTLANAAEGLGCRVVYVLIPQDQSLAALREQRALEKASEINRYTEGHMALEAQETSDEFKEQSIRLLADELLRTWPRDFWDD